jgi:hypothetical protein
LVESLILIINYANAQLEQDGMDSAVLELILVLVEDNGTFSHLLAHVQLELNGMVLFV